MVKVPTWPWAVEQQQVGASKPRSWPKSKAKGCGSAGMGGAGVRNAVERYLVDVTLVMTWPDRSAPTVRD